MKFNGKELAGDMKDKIITAVNMFLILCAGCVLGILLLVLAYCIPIDRIFYNFSTGIEGINGSGYYYYLHDYEASIADNFTEFLIVKATATPLPPSGENIVQMALRGYTLSEQEVQHGLKFYEYTYMGKEYSCDSYERYWHGYLVFLKPLMAVFTYSDIIFLNIAAQLLLMFGIIWTCAKKEQWCLAVSFLFFWLVNVQLTVMLCLDYSACFYIYAISTLVLMHSRKVRQQYVYFFLVVGMITSYMDFLTWPLITLGIPLTVFVLSSAEEEKKIGKIIAGSISWGFGYAVFWGMKWIIASVVLGENVIGDALSEVSLRSSSYGGDNMEKTISYLEVLKRNFSALGKKTFVLLALAMGIYLFSLMYKNRKNIDYKKLIPYVLIALLPFGWYLVTRNHSYMHCWMTWRILNISIFAVCCGVISMCRDNSLQR